MKNKSLQEISKKLIKEEIKKETKKIKRRKVINRPSKVKTAIKQLRAKGYHIKFRVRKDGGFIITKINGRRFKGAKGNEVAKRLVGIKTSTKVLTANRKNVRRAIPKLRKSIENYSGEKLFKKVQTALREAIKRGETYTTTIKGEKRTLPKFSGKITKKGLRKLIASKGVAKAEESLRNLWAKTHKLAYKESVELLKDRITRAFNKTGSSLFEDDYKKIIEFLDKNDISEEQKEEILGVLPDDSLTDVDKQLYYDSLENSEDVWDTIITDIKDILGI